MPVTFPIMLDGSTAAATPTENNVVTRSGKNTKINALEYDNSMISLREAVNDLHDKKAAQADLEAVQADALLKLQAMTEAESMALAAVNRDRYVSGFIEWGNYNTTCDLIQNGLWAYTGTANSIFLGRDKTNVGGESKSNFPYVNMRGNVLYLKYINESGGYSNAILLPPAPATADILKRDDFVFLRMRHENVSDKDFAYPYGNSQSLVAIDPTTGLATVNGNFTGYNTYSLFGSWQSPGGLVGRGLVWSAMSDSNKKKFISEPKNNVYLSKDLEFKQVIYSTQVIPLIGSGHTLETAMAEAGYTQDSIDKGLWVSGDYYAIPICLVPRLNQGAYHYPLNTNGSRGWRSTVTPGVIRKWYLSDATKPTVVSDCFNFTADLNGASTYGGSIAEGYSGRPGDKLYDAIYESDVKDLRVSAHKITDFSRCRDREFQRLNNSEIRGWDTGKSISATSYTGVTTAIWQASGVWNVSLSPATGLSPKTRVLVKDGGNGWWVGVMLTAGTVQSINGQSWAGFDRSTSTSYTVRSTDEEHGAKSKTLLRCDIIGDPENYYRGYYDYLSSSGVQTFTSGDVVKVDEITINEYADVGHFYLCRYSGSTYDLAAVNYKNETNWEDLGTDREDSWFTNKIPGTPLLVGKNGENLIPDGTAKTFKLSRKANSAPVAIIYTADGGATYSNVVTSWVNSFWNSTTNSLEAAAINSAAAVLVFYLSEADPFEAANNANVLSRGDVWAGNFNQTKFISDLIGKVAVGTSNPIELRTPLKTWAMNGDKLLTVASGAPTHELLSLPATDPAVKVHDYLTSENGKAYLQLLFKEMIHNGTSWGDDGKFNVIDGVSTITDDNGNSVLIGQKRVELPYFIGDAE